MAHHRLSTITVKNLRSIKDEVFPLDDFTALIGYNNAGKTNILLACKWLLLAHSLPEDSFNDPFAPVEVSGTFRGLTRRLLERLPPEEGETLSAFAQNGEVRVMRRQYKPGINPEQIEFLIFNPCADDEEDIWLSIPDPARKGLFRLFPKPIYMGSLDDQQLGGGSGNQHTIVGKLIAEIVKPIEEEYGASIRGLMRDLRNLLAGESWSKTPELAHFDKVANENLEPLFPSVRVELEIPEPRLGDIFRASTLLVYENDEKMPRDIGNMGHGARRTIQMALIRHLAEVRKQNIHVQSKRLLLIDSPELFLHPQAVELVRVSLKKLSREGYQVIFATHSAQMVTSEDVATSLLIRKTSQRGTFKRQRIEDAVRQVIKDAPSQLQLLFSLSNSNELLFADNVLLTEGKTELRILPRIFERLTDDSFALIKCALIRQGGVSNTRKSIQVLHAMDLPVKAIVDLDYAFTNGTSHKFLKRKDPDLNELMRILERLSREHGIRLMNGLPVNKNSSMSAAQAFALLAQQEEAKPLIQNLHSKLLKSNIWLWTQGAIEEHLGLKGKNESTWSNFLARLRREEPEHVIPDFKGVKRLMHWIKQR